MNLAMFSFVGLQGNFIRLNKFTLLDEVNFLLFGKFAS